MNFIKSIAKGGDSRAAVAAVNRVSKCRKFRQMKTEVQNKMSGSPSIVRETVEMFVNLNLQGKIVLDSIPQNQPKNLTKIWSVAK